MITIKTIPLNLYYIDSQFKVYAQTKFFNSRFCFKTHEIIKQEEIKYNYEYVGKTKVDKFDIIKIIYD